MPTLLTEKRTQDTFLAVKEVVKAVVPALGRDPVLNAEPSEKVKVPEEIVWDDEARSNREIFEITTGEDQVRRMYAPALSLLVIHSPAIFEAEMMPSIALAAGFEES